MLLPTNNKKLSCIEAFFFVSHNPHVTQICPKREVCNFFETKQSILLVEKLPGSPTKGCVVFKIMYQQEISIVYSLLFLIWRSEWKSPLYWIKVSLTHHIHQNNIHHVIVKKCRSCSKKWYLGMIPFTKEENSSHNFNNREKWIHIIALNHNSKYTNLYN